MGDWLDCGKQVISPCRSRSRGGARGWRGRQPGQLRQSARARAVAAAHGQHVELEKANFEETSSSSLGWLKGFETTQAVSSYGGLINGCNWNPKT